MLYLKYTCLEKIYGNISKQEKYLKVYELKVEGDFVCLVGKGDWPSSELGWEQELAFLDQYFREGRLMLVEAMRVLL